MLDSLAKMEKMAESSVRMKDEIERKDAEIKRLSAERANHKSVNDFISLLQSQFAVKNRHLIN